VVNETIKPWQTQGLQGERDIARRPFEVCPIPPFDREDSLHRQIVDIAHEARTKMIAWRARIEGNTAQARQRAKKVVQPELDNLNDLVRVLLKKNKFLEEWAEKRPSLTENLFAMIAEQQ
jgi:hypothetical protein